MQIRHVAAWFVLLAVAIMNGGLRDLTYGKYLSELHANQISCASGILLFAVVIREFVNRWPPASAREAWFIGAFWLVLTMAFEFLFFHYVGGHSWAELLANYDVASGRLWPLILVWVTVAPYFFYRLFKRRNLNHAQGR
jgi:hypothetical protein